MKIKIKVKGKIIQIIKEKSQGVLMEIIVEEDGIWIRQPKMDFIEFVKSKRNNL